MTSAADGDTSPAQRTPDATSRVMRNAAWLAGGQFLAAPLALFVNSVAAHQLGPRDFAWIYLATTYAGFGFLVVEWGQGGTLTAMIARERAHALQWLASSLTLRACLVLPVVAALLLLGTALHYPAGLLVVLCFSALAAAGLSVSTACMDVFRGLERGALSGASYLAAQILAVAVVVPTLLLGAGLRGFLLAQVACSAIGALILMAVVRRMAEGTFAPGRDRIRQLFLTGRPFLVFGLVLSLQANLDALFLSRLVPATVVGWSAVATKLVGMLIFPATALSSSLYPTLCRIGLQDAGLTGRTIRASVRLILICSVPLALGCELFPGIGVAIYGGAAYRASENNLHILAPYVFLVYLTMPLGSSLIALGRQRAWTWAQLACVLVSVALDPLLIPWFQEHYGNGGLGVCVSMVLSEILMLISALVLLPVPLADPELRRTIVHVAVGACALVLVAQVAPWVGAWCAAGFGGVAYVAVLAAFGELPWRRALNALAARRR